MAGNVNSGKRKDKQFHTALSMVLAKLATTEGRGLNRIAEKLIQMAEDGDIQAIKEVADRLDGKPAQAIIGGEDDDNPIRVEVAALEYIQSRIAGLASRAGTQGNSGGPDTDTGS
jgi:ribosomal protein L17